MLPLDKGLQWVNVKQKPIQMNLGTFRHSQTYPRIIQAYSGIFRTLCYLDIFYNCGISRTLTYSEPKAYSERWHIQKLRHIQNPVVHLRWSVIITRLQLFSQIIQQLFSQSLLPWKKYFEVVSPEVELCYVIINYGARGDRGPWIFNILTDLNINQIIRNGQ